MSAPVDVCNRFGSLKPQDWPDIDRAMMAKAREKGGLFRPGGPAAKWSPATVETVQYRYGVFLWWLQETGRLDASAAPFSRATPEVVEGFVAAYGAGHASVSLANVLHGLHEALRAMQPQVDLSLMRRAVSRLKAAAKPRPKITRMADVDELQELGQALIGHGSDRLDERHMLSALAVRDGLLILALIARPLRRADLMSLQIGRTLLADERGYRLKLVESKTGAPYDADYSDALTAAFDLYVHHARPILLARANKADEGWLWLGAEGERMTGKSLSRRLRALILEHLGRPMSAHLFRDCAATGIALRSPEDIGIVAPVLGHARHETSEQYYNQAKSVEAFRRHQELIDRERGNDGRDG